MIIDGLLNFCGGSGGIGNADSKTDSPTTGTQYSSNVLDLGASLPASASGGGARDIGTGDDPSLKLLVAVSTAFTSGTSMYVILQGAPDNGSGSPGSYTTMYTSPTVLEASLVAGARLADIDIPRPVPGQALPRYLRLGFVTSGTHTTGAVWGTIVVDRMDQPQQANATMGGYPAGIVVAN